MQAELKAQRDELQRQREALQKQMDLFEQQKSQFNKTMADQQAQQAQQQQARTSPSQQQRERSESPASSGSSLERTHKRAGSTDLHSSREGSPFEPMTAGYSNSLKEPLTNKPKSRAPAVVMAAGGPSASRAKSGDVKGGSILQQLPLRLASKGAVVKSGAAAAAAAGASGGGVKQTFPFKLAASSNTTAQTVVTSANSNTVTLSGHGSSSSLSGSDSAHRLMQQTRSHPTLPSAATSSAKSRTVSQQNSLSNVLPLKLAESKSSQRPSSASLTGARKSQAAGEHSKSGKKEPEIFF